MTYVISMLTLRFDEFKLHDIFMVIYVDWTENSISWRCIDYVILVQSIALIPR